MINIINQKEDQFAKIAQDILTQTLSQGASASGNKTLAIGVQVASIGVNVGKAISEINELEGFLVQEIPGGISKAHKELPDFNGYIQTIRAYWGPLACNQISQELEKRGIIDKRFNVNLTSSLVMDCISRMINIR